MDERRKKVLMGICSLAMVGICTGTGAEAAEIKVDGEWLVSNEAEAMVLSDAAAHGFQSVLEAKIGELGICDTQKEEDQETGLFYPGTSSKGVCYAVFLDMEKDEVPELYLLSYDQETDGQQILKEEIYLWNGSEAECIFEERYTGIQDQEIVTEIYHESGPIGRYQQGVLNEKQGDVFFGTLYRMSQDEIETYLSADTKQREEQAGGIYLEYQGEESSYQNISDLQIKLRTLVGGNMRSKLISGIQDNRIIYDEFCTPVICEEKQVYAAYNDVSGMQELLGASGEGQTEAVSPKSEEETELDTEAEQQESEEETERETETEQLNSEAAEPKTETVQPESEEETQQPNSEAEGKSDTETETPKSQEETETAQPDSERTEASDTQQGRLIEPEMQQTETAGMEEMKYYLYIQSQLVPVYGLMTSSEMMASDTGLTGSGSTTGVMSAAFSDVNGDGVKEMILSYLKTDPQNNMNQVVFELYGLQEGSVVKYDDTVDYPMDKQNRISIWENTEVYVKGTYLCAYRVCENVSSSNRLTDLYLYDLSQNQITMIRDYQFTRVPGTVAMSEGVQQINYYAGNETEISDIQKTETENKVKAELEYFGLSDLAVLIGDPAERNELEQTISGIKMWESTGIDPGNFTNQTVFFSDSSGLMEYVVPMQTQQITETEAAAPLGSYILPGSDNHYLTQEEINSVPSNLLEYACNEIYARHGRKFVDSAFQDYFNSQPWYHGTVEPSQFDTGVFNVYETENILKLVERMQALGIR